MQLVEAGRGRVPHGRMDYQYHNNNNNNFQYSDTQAISQENGNLARIMLAVEEDTAYGPGPVYGPGSGYGQYAGPMSPCGSTSSSVSNPSAAASFFFR